MADKINLTDTSAVLAGLRADHSTFAARVTWLKNTGAKVDAVTHALALYCIYQSMPADATVTGTGNLNISPTMDLMGAMPKSSRAKALAAWFNAFSNVRVTEAKGKWSVKLVKPGTDDFKADIDLNKAKANPFWIVPEKATAPEEFSLVGQASAFLARMAKKVDKMTPDEKAAFRAMEALVKDLAPVAPVKDTTPASGQEKGAPEADKGTATLELALTNG